MNILIRQQLAHQTPSRWKRAYVDRLGDWVSNDKKGIYDRLIALGKNPIPEQVDEIIGNSSWTRLVCHECKASVGKVIILGEPGDYESATVHLCWSCIKKAHETMRIS